MFCPLKSTSPKKTKDVLTFPSPLHSVLCILLPINSQLAFRIQMSLKVAWPLNMWRPAQAVMTSLFYKSLLCFTRGVQFKYVPTCQWRPSFFDWHLFRPAGLLCGLSRANNMDRASCGVSGDTHSLLHTKLTNQFRRLFWRFRVWQGSG